MNQNWKIVLSSCLAIAICFTMASAAIDFSLTKSSLEKSSAAAFADAKASAMENMKTGFDKPAFNPPDPIVKPDVPVKPTVPEITRPAFNPLPAPTFHVPEWGMWSNPSSSGGTSGATITRDTAIEIALAQYPGYELEPIRLSLERINYGCIPDTVVVDPGLVVFVFNPYWIVELMGVDSGCASYDNAPGYGENQTSMACTMYRGKVFIDAVTGKILYKSTLS